MVTQQIRYFCTNDVILKLRAQRMKHLCFLSLVIVSYHDTVTIYVNLLDYCIARAGFDYHYELKNVYRVYKVTTCSILLPNNKINNFVPQLVFREF